MPRGSCHSQLHQLHNPDLQRPLLLGHEATGVVTAKGSEVSHVREGDRVMVTWVPREITVGRPRRAAHAPQLSRPRARGAQHLHLGRARPRARADGAAAGERRVDGGHGDHRLRHRDRGRRRARFGEGAAGRHGCGVWRRRRRDQRARGRADRAGRPDHRRRPERREAGVREGVRCDGRRERLAGSIRWRPSTT